MSALARADQWHIRLARRAARGRTSTIRAPKRPCVSSTPTGPSAPVNSWPIPAWSPCHRARAALSSPRRCTRGRSSRWRRTAGRLPSPIAWPATSSCPSRPREQRRRSFRSGSRRTAIRAYPRPPCTRPIPGHHWHITWSKIHASPVRRVLGTPYFTEGWALYAERVMRERGFFTEPIHELNHLAATIFRAARIVVDTSLHIG